MVGSPRSGNARAGHREAPVRTCVGCRRRASVSELLRVVRQDGQVVVDERRRLPGRGAWLHPEPDCLAKAERRRAFPRALRSSGTLDVTAVRRHLEPRTG
ncbi:YlxR family protein [Amycolatopsis acidiphila]|uniref:YlxR family protein n=1 Tax=Amycolatopsis acidiphila TaxID=715473 RepID=A0A557ZS25_9PSEU|nr:YlxR family protein [Amycolatopsis acidiphila]TVT14817.1 YlxR family protein [Amycolatopsis acidiphila]UIJ62086.1 YlxR family protein [Amycolatopsis acidiphila]